MAAGRLFKERGVEDDEHVTRKRDDNSSDDQHHRHNLTRDNDEKLRSMKVRTLRQCQS